MAGIATRYRGIEYRSRLEARWAAFMHGIGWDITYEPFDGDGYIPDFLVAGPSPLLIEVKPAVTPDEYEAPIAKITNGVSGVWDHDLLIVGVTPFPQRMGGSWKVAAGWLGEHIPGCERPCEWGDWHKCHGSEICWDAGDWFKCLSCRRVNVFHSLMSFTGRPCGCYEGDGHLGDAPLPWLRDIWANACNDVKWRGSAA